MGTSTTRAHLSESLTGKPLKIVHDVVGATLLVNKCTMKAARLWAQNQKSLTS